MPCWSGRCMNHLGTNKQDVLSAFTAGWCCADITPLTMPCWLCRHANMVNMCAPLSALQSTCPPSPPQGGGKKFRHAQATILTTMCACMNVYAPHPSCMTHGPPAGTVWMGEQSPSSIAYPRLFPLPWLKPHGHHYTGATRQGVLPARTAGWCCAD